jgi:hypothetical protein
MVPSIVNSTVAIVTKHLQKSKSDQRGGISAWEDTSYTLDSPLVQ